MERATVPFTEYNKDDPLRHAFRNVDETDWWHLHMMLRENGHGKFWKAVFAEVRAALEASD